MPPAATVVPLRVTSSKGVGRSPPVEEVTLLLHRSLPATRSTTPTWLHAGYFFSLDGFASAKTMAAFWSSLMCRDALHISPASGTVQSLVPLSRSYALISATPDFTYALSVSQEPLTTTVSPTTGSGSWKATWDLVLAGAFSSPPARPPPPLPSPPVEPAEDASFLPPLSSPPVLE